VKESTSAGYIELQKYLISIGASYLLVADLETPQNGPVVMNAGAKGAFTSGNTWLLVPWDDDVAISIRGWIQQFLQQSRLQPDLTIVVTSSAIEEQDARQLKRDIGRRLAVCRIDEKRVFNDPQAERKLEHLFDPQYAPKFQAVDVDRMVREWSERKNADRKFYASLFQKTPHAYFTIALTIVNVIVFLWMAASTRSLFGFTTEDLLKWGANYAPRIHAGEWWRLIAAAFIHVNAIHILFNMWCLWNLGAIAERAFGNNRFLIIYLLAAVGGSMASIQVHPQIVSAGASGAVFGISGALVAFLWRNKTTVPPGIYGILKRNMIQFIGFNVLFGLVNPVIDNTAHIGGLLTGFVAGVFLNPNSADGFLYEDLR
jgi:membrane associated rhomboid family serine protease